MTGWTVLAGCGKTTLARENFEGPHVWYNSRTLPQDAQKGQTSHPPNPGAPRRAFPKQGRSEQPKDGSSKLACVC